MKKAEVVVGGIYVGKGPQVSKDTEVRLLQVEPMRPGSTDERFLTEDMKTGIKRWKNKRSFMSAYKLKALPDATFDSRVESVFLTTQEIKEIIEATASEVIRRVVAKRGSDQ